MTADVANARPDHAVGTILTWFRPGLASPAAKPSGRRIPCSFWAGSFNNPTYINGQAGAVYKERAPLVNAARPAGEWQSFDVVFVAPRFAADGSVLQPARMTAFQNGVLVQHDTVLTGPTPNGPTFHQSTLPPYASHPAKLPLVLQDHRHPVAFRNIWIRNLTLPEK